MINNLLEQCMKLSPGPGDVVVITDHRDDYNQETIEAFAEAWADHNNGSLLMILPSGVKLEMLSEADLKKHGLMRIPQP